jgi:hypothetical protein
MHTPLVSAAARQAQVLACDFEVYCYILKRREIKQHLAKVSRDLPVESFQNTYNTHTDLSLEL